MKKYIYITPEHFDTAAANGISAARVRYRIRRAGWSITLAISKPSRPRRKVAEDWVKIAERNGVSRQRYNDRISVQGWSEEQAATTPIDASKQRFRS